MSEALIICVAITGSVPRKCDNPAVPTTVAEQVESTQEAFEAGASICHAHVRNDDESPSSSPERFAQLLEGVQKHCPGMVVQLSTGGRSGAGKERGGMISLKPDMCSLSVGSNNFPTRVYSNPPDLVDWLAAEMKSHQVIPEVECFDLSHLHQARRMHDDGRLPATPYCQFVLGVKNALPADRHAFDCMLSTKKKLFGDAPWCAAGIGRFQIEVKHPIVKASVGTLQRRPCALDRCSCRAIRTAVGLARANTKDTRPEIGRLLHCYLIQPQNHLTAAACDATGLTLGNQTLGQACGKQNTLNTLHVVSASEPELSCPSRALFAPGL